MLKASVANNISCVIQILFWQCLKVSDSKLNKGFSVPPPLKNLYNIPRILEWGLYLEDFLPEACLVSESAAVLGAIRADKMCLLHGFYLHPPTVREVNHFLNI